MSEREIHPLPEYTEQAMGYVWDKPLVRWVAVYQRLKGEVVWHDGMTQDSVPEGLFPIMESLWGALPQGYAYILDLEERRVDVVLRTALEAILQEVKDSKRFKSWYLEETDGQRVSQMLIAYGERLVRRSARQDCQECYLGYQWLPAVAQFSPCWWCNPMGE